MAAPCTRSRPSDVPLAPTVLSAPRAFGRLAGVLIVVGALLGFQDAAAREKAKEDTVSIQSLYPIQFGSPGRNSATAGTSRAQGQLDWSRPLELSPGDLPIAVLHWGTQVVVETTNGVQAFTADGAHVFSQRKRVGTQTAIANGGLHLVTPSTQLQVFDPTGRPAGAAMPIATLASNQFHLVLLWPRSSDVIAGANNPDPAYDEEQIDKPPPEPMLFGSRTPFGHVVPEWTERFVGDLTLRPLFAAGPEQWLVGLDKIHVVNVETGERTAIFSADMDRTTAWSVGPDGPIAIIGYRNERKVLSVRDLNGAERWSWTDLEDDDGWAADQPPLQSGQGPVFALTRGRVLALDAGKLVWTYDARSESLRHGASTTDGSFEIKEGRLVSTEQLRYGTLLSDGSLLVTGRRTLRHIDAEGQARFSITLPEDLLTPPIVDGDGHVYVASAHSLYCIR
jgi:outer membrane protein assembly factor BamB